MLSIFMMYFYASALLQNIEMTVIDIYHNIQYRKPRTRQCKTILCSNENNTKILKFNIECRELVKSYKNKWTCETGFLLT